MTIYTVYIRYSKNKKQSFSMFRLTFFEKCYIYIYVCVLHIHTTQSVLAAIFAAHSINLKPIIMHK